MTPPPPSQTKVDKQSYVYLLRSLKDEKFYLGWTTDLLRRVAEHNMGLTKSTKGRIPLELVYFEIFLNPRKAKEREFKLKRNPNMYSHFKRRALIEWQKNGGSQKKLEEEVVG